MVVLLMLIPLLAPNESGAPFGLATISKALGLAAIKVQPPPQTCPLHRNPYSALYAGSMAKIMSKMRELNSSTSSTSFLFPAQSFGQKAQQFPYENKVVMYDGVPLRV